VKATRDAVCLARKGRRHPPPTEAVINQDHIWRKVPSWPGAHGHHIRDCQSASMEASIQRPASPVLNQNNAVRHDTSQPRLYLEKAPRGGSRNRAIYTLWFIRPDEINQQTQTLLTWSPDPSGTDVIITSPPFQLPRKDEVARPRRSLWELIREGTCALISPPQVTHSPHVEESRQGVVARSMRFSTASSYFEYSQRSDDSEDMDEARGRSPQAHNLEPTSSTRVTRGSDVDEHSPQGSFVSFWSLGSFDSGVSHPPGKRKKQRKHRRSAQSPDKSPKGTRRSKRVAGEDDASTTFLAGISESALVDSAINLLDEQRATESAPVPG
jgi:hypothetical protein